MSAEIKDFERLLKEHRFERGDFGLAEEVDEPAQVQGLKWKFASKKGR